MKDQEKEKVYEDKRNEEGMSGKRVYHTPMLQRLGKVNNLTQGEAPSVETDVFGVSF